MRIVGLLLLISLLSLLIPITSRAQVISINANGTLTWNVLAAETSINSGGKTGSAIEITKIASDNVSANSSVSLSKDSGKVNLVVTSGGDAKDLSFPSGDKNLVEVEARPQIQKLTIGLKGDKFSLSQQNVLALTDFPITVDAASARLSISTPSGDQYLSILPSEAVNIALRSRLISKVEGTLTILEENTEPSYKISGEKIFNFFNLYQYSIPITAYVSTASGELVSIDSPTWFKVLKFLFI